MAARCHNSSIGPWSPCSSHCGLGISTRLASIALGCSQLSKVRLCEQRRCAEEEDRVHVDTDSIIDKNVANYQNERSDKYDVNAYRFNQYNHKLHHHHHHQHHQHHHHNHQHYNHLPYHEYRPDQVTSTSTTSNGHHHLLYGHRIRVSSIFLS